MRKNLNKPESEFEEKPSAGAFSDEQWPTTGKITNYPRGHASVSRIFMMDGKSESSGSFQALSAGKSLALLVAQDPPQPLEVGGQYRQRHGAGKSPLAMISNPVQPAVQQDLTGWFQRSKNPLPHPSGSVSRSKSGTINPIYVHSEVSWGQDV